MPKDLPDLRRSSIVLVKLDGIGDFVLASGFLHIVHEVVPPEHVTFFCTRPTSELVRRVFPDWQVVELGERRDLWRGSGARALRRRLQAMVPFDLLIDLRAYRSLADSVVVSWIPSVMKLGLHRPELAGSPRFKADARIYDLLLEPSANHAGDGASLDLENYRIMARFLFPERDDVGGIRPKLHVTLGEREDVAAHVRSASGFDVNRPFLLVCPGAGHPIREYPVDKLGLTLRNIRQSSPIAVVVAGGRADSVTARLLMDELEGMPDVVDLTGRLDLGQHVALTSMATAVLTMETGSAHIAGALSRPSVVLIGGGHEGIFGPWGCSSRFRWLENRLPCYGCAWRCVYDYPACIHDIPTKFIETNVLEVLAEAQAGALG